MDKPMPALHFRIMACMFRVRDFFLPRIKVLSEAELKAGFRVLDYGCGTGSYTIAAAELVGPAGIVHALDIHPLAIQLVRERAAGKGLQNVETILSDSGTGLPDRGLDAVLLYDVFHGLSEPDKVLTELHRVLKPKGILSFNDHHLKEKEIVSRLTSGGLFRFLRKERYTYTFLNAR